MYDSIDDDEDMADDSMDQKELTKKDIHTLNEQKRRDNIKVCMHFLGMDVDFFMGGDNPPFYFMRLFSYLTKSRWI